MMEQADLYNFIENFKGFTRSESKSENATIKLTPSQKIVLSKMAEEQGRSLSALGSDLIEIGIHFSQHVDKFRKHGDLINLILSRLS